MKRPARTIWKIAAAAAACCMALGAAGCGWASVDDSSSPSASTSADAGPITVVASLNQWGSVAEQIGGDDVSVTSILGSASVDAHDFEPTTADVAKLEKADVVLVNGAGYDSWADKALGSGATRISVAETVGAMEGDNPHLWFSKDARNAVAKELCDTFSKLRSDRKDAFEANYASWSKGESALEETMKEFSAAHPGLRYAATESLAYYLMSDLGFEDATPKGFAQAMANGSEPAASDIKEFQELIDGSGVSLLVNNAQESNDTTKELVKLAQSKGIPVLDVTEQMPQDEQTLTDWISSLVEQVSSDLQQEDEASGEPSAQATPSGSADASSSAAQ